MQQLNPSDGNYQLFQKYVAYLNNGRIRYSLDDSDGVYYELVTDFAHAWRNTHPSFLHKWFHHQKLS